MRIYTQIQIILHIISIEGFMRQTRLARSESLVWFCSIILHLIHVNINLYSHLTAH